jgi:GTP-binding protein LepA
MVFVSFFPVDQDEFNLLEDALKKLRLNDAAISFFSTSSKALGRGFKCGFLGHLHAEVSQERLETDFSLSIIATSPTVEYKFMGDSETDSLTARVSGTALGTDQTAEQVKGGRAGRTHDSLEPWIRATIITPNEYVGAVISLCEDRRGKLSNMEYHGNNVTIFYELPLAEIITDFFDQLKSKSSGFASFDYEFLEYRGFDAVQLDILINHEPIDAFSQTLEKSRAEKFGKMIVEKLSEIIPRQQIPVPIQAAVNGQIIARADIKQFRKDVTAKLYGGDVTRRMKLLEKQQKGKEKMRSIGKVQIPNDTFLKVFKT